MAAKTSKNKFYVIESYSMRSWIPLVISLFGRQEAEDRIQEMRAWHPACRFRVALYTRTRAYKADQR